jgi:hypothetical protein
MVHGEYKVAVAELGNMLLGVMMMDLVAMCAVAELRDMLLGVMMMGLEAMDVVKRA